MSLPDVNNWANLTDAEQRTLQEASRAEYSGLSKEEYSEKYGITYDACLAVLQPYIESLPALIVADPKGHRFCLDNEDVQRRVKESFARTWAGWLPLRHPAVAAAAVEEHRNGGTIMVCESIVRCRACGLHSHIVHLTGNTLRIEQYGQDVRGSHVEIPACPIDPTKPYSVEIDIPSGQMVVSNHFSDLFDELPPDKKYADEYDICYVNGRKNSAEFYATQGYVELNIGNCACKMVATSRDHDAFTVGDYDSVGRREILASVCTDFWGYGVTDLDLAAKRGLDKVDREVFVVRCRPGRYRFTHRYHLCGRDSKEVYTYIDWIGPCADTGHDALAEELKGSTNSYS